MLGPTRSQSANRQIGVLMSTSHLELSLDSLIANCLDCQVTLIGKCRLDSNKKHLCFLLLQRLDLFLWARGLGYASLSSSSSSSTSLSPNRTPAAASSSRDCALIVMFSKRASRQPQDLRGSPLVALMQLLTGAAHLECIHLQAVRAALVGLLQKAG